MTSTSPQSTNSPPVARDTNAQPATLSIFSRTRRYSASYNGLTGPRLIHRVSQLRQEECASVHDINTREVSHEREVHGSLQIYQSWESLLLDDTDSWSIKSDSELSNPLTNALHVNLPTTGIVSTPSPTSNRNAIRLPPFGLSPSPPPFKKVFTDRCSPICRSPSLTCPSSTPNFYASKFSNSNSMSSSSLSSSPVAAPSPSMEIQIDLPSIAPSTELLTAATTAAAEPQQPSTTTTTTTATTTLNPRRMASDDCCDSDVNVEEISSDNNAKNDIELNV